MQVYTKVLLFVCMNAVVLLSEKKRKKVGRMVFFLAPCTIRKAVVGRAYTMQG